MAIYHFSAQVIGRSSGRSSVAAAAYRSGERLQDERTGLTHDYTKKSGVVYAEIITPSNAPEWAKDRQQLWNEVEKAEKRKDSQLAREINIALPAELTREQQIELARAFVKDTLVEKGMIADIAIHDNGTGNPHAHVMLTMRDIDMNGFGKKNRDWNPDFAHKKFIDKDKVVEKNFAKDTDGYVEWREKWAEYANKALKMAGLSDRIDHRTLEAQGIDREPQIHVGVHANAMEKKGIETERGQINRQIKELSSEKVVVLNEYKELKAELEQEKQRQAARYEGFTEKEKVDVKKAESIVEEPLNFENAADKIKALEGMKYMAGQEHERLEEKELQLRQKVSGFEGSLKAIESSQAELDGLEKNIIGKYKDKSRAQALKENMEQHERQLRNNGYSSSVMDVIRRTLEEIREKIKLVAERISEIGSRIEAVRNGVLALEQREIRKFADQYRGIIPQAGDLNYEEMKAIRELNHKAGRLMTVEDMKEAHIKCLDALNEINSRLGVIDIDGERLNAAKQALDSIDNNQAMLKKHVGSADVLESEKLKAYVKQQCNKAVKVLQSQGVKDAADYERQLQQHNKILDSAKPKLEHQRDAIQNTSKTLQNALESILRHQVDQKYQNTEFNGVKGKIIGIYHAELPSIRHITESTAKIIDELNQQHGHILTVKEIKALHSKLGHRLESESGQDILKEFNAVDEVVKDIQRAALVEKNSQTREQGKELTRHMSIEIDM